MTAGDKRDLSEGTECNLADQGDAKKSKTSHTAFLKEVLDRFFLAGKKEEEEKARKKEEEEKARKKEEEKARKKEEEEENNRLRLQAERRAEREAKLRADDDITPFSFFLFFCRNFSLRTPTEDNPRQQQADSVVQYLGSGKVDLSALTSEDLAEIIAIRVMEVLRMFEEELGVLPEGWMAQHAQLRYNLIASLGKVYDANLATLEPFIEILQGPGRLYFFHSHKLMSALEHLLRMAPPKEKKDEKKEMKEEKEEEDKGEEKGEVEKEDEKEEEDKGKCPAWLMLRMECSLASGGGGGGSGSSGGGGLGISKY